MAADVITRFRLETTQYDSALRDSSKALAAYAKQTESAGKDFTNFSQNAINAAKSLGQVASGATNTKDKLRDLVGAYNDVAKTYNKLSEVQRQTDFGKNMAASLEQLQVRIKETKQELYGLGDAVKGGGGGLFGGGKLDGMLQVFGGNLMTKAAGWATGFASEIGDAVKQGIELAKQGEGIRIAFERLGRGDILQGLREATHGTVTDLELMKAAVKFNDFKLPVEELGTMLAFAQQKAKDTGQSVDYMVDSIVTGLGRKSLMILDNLGLSATEVKEKMKETGDMTKAVGAIIRDQMAKAGDYVETAADRAAQANVSLQNKMEELGRKFAPVEEASSQLWTSMKIGILDVIGGPLSRLLNGLTEAGRLKNMLNSMNGEAGSGNTKVDQQLKKLNVIKKAGGSDYIFNSMLSGMMEDYNRQIMALDAKIKDTKKLSPDQQASKFVRDEVQKMSEQMKALGMMRDQLAAGAKEINKPIKIESNTPNVTGGGSGKGGKAEIEAAIGSIDAQTKKVQDLQKAWRAAADDKSREDIKKQIDEAQFALDKMLGKVKDRPKMEAIDMNAITPNGGIGSLVQDTRTRQQQGLTELKQKIKLELDTEALKSDTNTLQTILKDALKNGITGIDFQLMGLGDQIAKGINVPDEAWQSILDQYNTLREQIGLEPIKINFDTGGLENVDNDVDGLKKTISTTAKVVGTIGQAFNAIEDPAAKVSATVAMAIANIAMAYSDALAKDTTQKFNIVGFIASTAAAMISMGTTIASIHQATGYAEGGILKGNSYSGDNIMGVNNSTGELVGLNAGEVVLNRAQTAGLAQELEGAGGSRQVVVRGVLHGKDLFIAAENWAKSVGKGEFVTW